ncbi:g7704 [Coccomyxa elongata]
MLKVPAASGRMRWSPTASSTAPPSGFICHAGYAYQSLFHLLSFCPEYVEATSRLGPHEVVPDRVQHRPTKWIHLP